MAVFFLSVTGIRDLMPAREPVQLDSRDIILGSAGAASATPLSPDSGPLPPDRPLRVATYNVHKCTGLDFQRNPERIAAVINSLGADIVALQEVLCDPCDGPGAQLRLLAEKTGMQMTVGGPTVKKRDGRYGNALLSRYPITNVRLHNISLGAFEPRGIIDADIQVGDQSVRVIATHLGLWPMERNRQARRLLEIIPENPAGPLIVMGDMNVWIPGNPEMHQLYKRLGAPATMRSYPAPFPMMSLERIWVLPAEHKVKVAVETSPSRLAPMASDHLPMVAAISFIR